MCLVPHRLFRGILILSSLFERPSLLIKIEDDLMKIYMIHNNLHDT